MKKVFSLVVLITTFIFFTGCQGRPPFPVIKKIDNSQVVEIDIMEEFSPRVQFIVLAGQKTELYLYDGIKKAAEYSLSQGYTHFAVLNGGINNLEGFPITNYNDLRSYCFSYKVGPFYASSTYEKCENISRLGRNEITLKIIPVNESDRIFSWNAREVLAELK